VNLTSQIELGTHVRVNFRLSVESIFRCQAAFLFLVILCAYSSQHTSGNQYWISETGWGVVRQWKVAEHLSGNQAPSKPFYVRWS